MSAAARDLGFLLIAALLARLSLIFLLATYRGGKEVRRLRLSAADRPRPH